MMVLGNSLTDQSDQLRLTTSDLINQDSNKKTQIEKLQKQIKLLEETLVGISSTQEQQKVEIEQATKMMDTKVFNLEENHSLFQAKAANVENQIKNIKDVMAEKGQIN